MASWFGFLTKKSYGAFHVKCGPGIVFSNERRTAHVEALSCGLVYSSKPIPAGGMFQVKVLENGNFTGIVSDLLAGKLYASKCYSSQIMDTYK